MKNILLNVLIVLLCFHPVHAETITINFDDWCPYSCVTPETPERPDFQKPGYELEIIHAIFIKRGIRFNYRFLPWARAIKEAELGRLDALLSPSKEEAPGLVFPKEEIGMLEWCFYTRKDSTWTYRGVASLRRVCLGVLLGNDFGPKIGAYISQNRRNSKLILVEYSDNWIELQLKKLEMGRVSAVLDEPVTLDYYIKLNGLSGRFRKAGCLERVKMYVAFSPENPRAKQYAQMFDKGIRKLRKTGALEEILSSYGLMDWK